MPPIFKKKLVWIPAVCALLVALYALAGFVWAPKLLRGALIDGIDKNLGLKASVGEIRINPFLMQLEVKDFSLPGEAGGKLLGFDRLFVDFDLSSLWHRALVFHDIEIARPFAHAIVASDGQLNLAALKPKTAQPTPPPKGGDEPLPAIQIGSFSVSGGMVSYEDRSRADKFFARLDPIGFELKDFTTGVEGGRFKFTGASKLGERLQWQGHLSLQPLQSDGAFQVSGLQAHTIWEYVQQQVGFFVHSGTIDLNGEYKFALRQNPELQVNLAEVSLKDLRLRPAENEQDWITVPQFSVRATSVDLSKRTVHVDAVTIAGAGLNAWLEPDGRVNLLRLAGPATPASNAAAAPTGAASAAPPPAATPSPSATLSTNAVASKPAAAEPAWQVSLSEFAVTDANISAEDRSVTPAAKVVLAPLNFKVTDASLDLSKPLNLQFDTGINRKGHLSVAGSLTPAPLSADVKVKLTGVELKAIQPYLARQTALTLLDGSLNLDGNLHFAPTPAEAGPPVRQRKPKLKAKPTMEFAGSLSIDRLHTIDNELKKNLISWNRLQVEGIDFQQGPAKLDVEKITARKLYARVLIAPDQSLNVARVLAGPNGLPASPASAPVSDAKPAEKPRKAHSSKGSSKQASAAASPSPAPSAPLMPISIRRIIVQESNANFSDLSIQPNFSAGIQALEGTVTGLSTKPDSHAKIDLHGQVDRFSPVSIQGEVNVFNATLYTDLAMSFRNMELTTFNPYSGKFAGYNISKGKLTTELKYKIEGRKLNAGHHVIIDQLEFGEKTASKDAVTLPIKLAVALLKDRNGVIDLDVPVTGSLDDPQFRLGPIIWKVVVNLLVKIVTSPFALIGSLFGGGPDLQFVDFPAGLAVLDEAGQNKVKTVEKALVERPQLKISLPLADVPDLDRPALVEARLREAVRAQQGLKTPRKKGAEAAEPPAFDSLPTPDQLEVLTAVYKKQVGSAPEFPKPAADAGAAAEPKAQAKAEAVAAKIQFLHEALLKQFTVADQDVKVLAQHRAEAIQRLLLEDKQIDPSRVFLVANNKAKPQGQAVRLELTLE